MRYTPWTTSKKIEVHMTPGDNLQNASDPDPQEETANGLLGFQTLADFLETDGWKPRRLEGKNAFSMGFSGKNGDFRCYAVVRVDLEEFLFYVVAPVRVPDAVRPAVAEFITRANYGMRIGNFELDYSDGEVRFKSSFNFENEVLTEETIRNTLYPAVHTIDRYLPGLLRVSFGGATPVEAIEEIEGSADSKED
jgi:hypothetical protein